MDCSLPGSSVHGIFQARVLEWVAISFSNPVLLPSYFAKGETDIERFRGSQDHVTGNHEARIHTQAVLSMAHIQALGSSEAEKNTFFLSTSHASGSMLGPWSTCPGFITLLVKEAEP